MTDIAELIADTRERARLRGNHRGNGEPDWVLTRLADALEALNEEQEALKREWQAEAWDEGAIATLDAVSEWLGRNGYVAAQAEVDRRAVEVRGTDERNEQ